MIKYADKKIWTDMKMGKPKEFDMCELVTDKGEVKKGWCTGSGYDGLHVKQSDVFVKWRRIVFVKCAED